MSNSHVAVTQDDGRIGCSCGASGPGPAATISDRRAWFDGHNLAAAVAPQPGIPLVDLGATVDGLLAHAAALRVTAGYLEQVAAVLIGTPDGD